MATMTQTAVPVNAARLAKAGDARALLAIPDARIDIPRILEGKRGDRGPWYARHDLATDFAGRKAIAEAKLIVEARQRRREARKGESGRVLQIGAERKAARLEARRQQVQPLLHEAFRGLYRVYGSRITVRFGEPAVSVHTTTKWVSGRGGFGHVTDGQVTHFTVPETWISDVHDRGLDYLDGLLTLSADLVEDRDGIEVFRSSWVRQGRGYDLHCESGCIARHVHPFGGAVTTYHSPKGDPKAAVAGLRRKMTAQAIPADVQTERARQTAAKRTERQARQLGRLVERVVSWDLGEIRHVVVSRADSIRAGNCEPGTDQFIARFFPDRDGDAATATIGEIASRVGRIDPASLRGSDLTLARQLAAACLVAIRRDKQARRPVLA